MMHKGSTRTGSVLCWLVALMAGAASGAAAPSPAEVPAAAGHALPPLVRYAPAIGALPANVPPAKLSIEARRELDDLLKQPLPSRDGLWGIDLSRNVRLAVLCPPESHTNRLGQSTANVPVFRLEG